MFLLGNLSGGSWDGFLRASGGVSEAFCQVRHRLQFSPRKRRCFLYMNALRILPSVFSAQAEVFPALSPLPRLNGSFLRASGGVSKRCRKILEVAGFSPRKRRCFRVAKVSYRLLGVFSAQAEVFPRPKFLRPAQARFLRASGGVSEDEVSTLTGIEFSPRKRRCFQPVLGSPRQGLVFSAQAEVFPTSTRAASTRFGFLRASGGVSVACRASLV